MNISESTHPSKNQLLSFWRGLGFWNFYFIAKLALYWGGYLNFHAFYNLLFAAVLLFPLPPLWLHRLRHIAAIPAGVALLYYDSWLPPFSRLLDQPEVLQFSNAYLLELLGRFINWDMVGIGFILLVAYLFLAQWLRMTFFTVIALIVVLLPTTSLPSLPRIDFGTDAQLAASPMAIPTVPVAKTDNEPTANRSMNDILNDELSRFYQTEQERHIAFAQPAEPMAPFDLLFLNICSLSWSDLDEVHLRDHPLFQQMDIVFDDFNSATSYSGPAVTRLMQANCGQPSHKALYEDAPLQCSLFSNLKAMGFETEVTLNHDGEFQGFIDEIVSEEAFSKPLIPHHLDPVLRGFDASPIWGDYDTLNTWLSTKSASADTKPSALLYNSITLHDGNREATGDGGGRTAPYQKRAQTMLDDLERFMTQLERSGRQVAVVFVPEHGAALQGDKMQISGMREIPTPFITHVPVGVRLIGTQSGPAEQPVHITTPSSYLAIADLVGRLISQNSFAQANIDWQALTANLAQTPYVAENEGSVMMKHEGVPYIRLNGKNWIKYQ